MVFDSETEIPDFMFEGVGNLGCAILKSDLNQLAIDYTSANMIKHGRLGRFLPSCDPVVISRLKKKLFSFWPFLLREMRHFHLNVDLASVDKIGLAAYCFDAPILTPFAYCEPLSNNTTFCWWLGKHI